MQKIRAFLIGAGATRAQYPMAPLNSDFFTKLKDVNGNTFRHIERNIQQYIHGEKLENLNIEYVTNLAYEFPSSIRDDFLECINLAVYNLLAGITESMESDILDAIRNNVNVPPTKFKRLLTDSRLNPEDFFITLNYDLYLDREILRIQNSIDYGIPSSMIHGRDKLIQENKKSEFSLYHLHGALNWFRVNDSSIFIRAGSFIPEVKRTGPTLCIVPPGKKEIFPVLKAVWDNALNRLKQADELIIIGCSLNPADIELINLVKIFLNNKGANKIKVIYHNSDTTCVNNYHAILGNEFKYYQHGFDLTHPMGYEGAIEFIFKS